MSRCTQLHSSSSLIDWSSRDNVGHVSLDVCVMHLSGIRFVGDRLIAHWSVWKVSVNKAESSEHSLVQTVCDERLQRTGIYHDKTGYHSAGTSFNLIKRAYMNV